MKSCIQNKRELKHTNVFDREVLVRTFALTLLQIFCKIILYCKVIVKSMEDPYDNFFKDGTLAYLVTPPCLSTSPSRWPWNPESWRWQSRQIYSLNYSLYKLLWNLWKKKWQGLYDMEFLKKGILKDQIAQMKPRIGKMTKPANILVKLFTVQTIMKSLKEGTAGIISIIKRKDKKY